MDALLTQSQLRRSGHPLHIQDNSLPKQLFYGELTAGHRPRRRPKLRYKDTLKKNLQKCDTDEKQWKIMAQAGLDGRMLFAREQKLMKTKDKAEIPHEGTQTKC